MRNRLIIRMLNVRQIEESMIYKTIGDIALTLWIYIGHTEENIVTLKARRDMFPGTTEEELFEEALRNTEKIFPAKIFDMEKLLFEPEYKADDFLSADITDETLGITLSNEYTLYGASVIFYPSVLEKLTKEMKTGFYIAFTSVHEMIVHPDNTMDKDSIRYALARLSDSCNLNDCFLTSHVYHFDINTGLFSMV